MEEKKYFYTWITNLFKWQQQNSSCIPRISTLELSCLALPLLRLLRTSPHCEMSVKFPVDLWFLFGWLYFHSPSLHILWRITLLGGFVVYLTGWAAQWTLVNAIQAHVEFLAICGVRVFWMGNDLASRIWNFGALRRTSEFIRISVQFCKIRMD